VIDGGFVEFTVGGGWDFIINQSKKGFFWKQKGFENFTSTTFSSLFFVVSALYFSM